MEQTIGDKLFFEANEKLLEEYMEAAKTDKAIEFRLNMWAADCAARVLHIYEKHVPDDDRPRTAILAARAFARGEIGAAARAAAGAAAGAAAWDAARAAARDAAGAAAGAAERKWQFQRLAYWMGELDPVDLPLPDKPSQGE